MEEVLIKSVSDYIQYTQIVSNLSRQKMLLMTICSMIKTRSVVLSEIAVQLNDDVKTDSNETRLRDFFREVEFNYDELAKFIFVFLMSNPHQKIRLTIDRTNWEFGNHSINILMIIASNGKNHLPIYWKLLDNDGGNSNSEQRNDLVQKCIDLLGAQRIGLLLGDREFIGLKWLKYLKKNNIRFCVRVPKSHLIETTDHEKYHAQEVWDRNKRPVKFQTCQVDGVWGSALVSIDAKGELLYLFGNANVDYFDQFYKKRWTIETMFQSFKSRGLDLEKTHLKINDRIKKLVGVVSLAFAFCISLGVFIDEKEKKIPLKNHKRKTKSFFRCGLDFIRDCLKANYKYRKECERIFKDFIQFIFINNDFSIY
jgi:hypothetical protein